EPRQTVLPRGSARCRGSAPLLLRPALLLQLEPPAELGQSVGEGLELRLLRLDLAMLLLDLVQQHRVHELVLDGEGLARGRARDAVWTAPLPSPGDHPVRARRRPCRVRLFGAEGRGRGARGPAAGVPLVLVFLFAPP